MTKPFHAVQGQKKDLVVKGGWFTFLMLLKKVGLKAIIILGAGISSPGWS